MAREDGWRLERGQEPATYPVCSKWCAVFLKPRQIGIFQQWPQRRTYGCMVVVQPRAFLGIEQARFQNASVERAEGQCFEGVELAKFALLGFDHHGEVFVADAMARRLIYAGL